jgi:hypothetical protein
MLIAAILLFAACDVAPNFVDSRDVEDAAAHERWATVCRGLEMEHEKTRRVATRKLLASGVPEGKSCICQFVGKESGDWDAAIVEGLAGATDDSIVGCFAEMVRNPALPRRAEAVHALGRTNAPTTRTTLSAIAVDPGDPAARKVAIEAVGGFEENRAAMLTLLSDDADPAIRSAAAAALSIAKTKNVRSQLVKAAKSDPDGQVRGAALRAAKKAGAPGAHAMVCDAMLNDPSPEVRKEAVLAFKGTKRDSSVVCLRKKAFTIEEDADVREAMLTVLKSSPNDNAAQILCDAIPFWMRSYVKEDIPDKIPGTMIVKAQNDRDWDRSYKCFQKAYRQSRGYSCFAKMHVALWFREVGGTSHAPKCPGYEGVD